MRKWLRIEGTITEGKLKISRLESNDVKIGRHHKVDKSWLAKVLGFRASRSINHLITLDYLTDLKNANINTPLFVPSA